MTLQLDDCLSEAIASQPTIGPPCLFFFFFFFFFFCSLLLRSAYCFAPSLLTRKCIAFS